MLAIAGITIVVALSLLTMIDILASILAFIPTGWGRLLICVTWKPVFKKITEISEVDDRFCIYLEYVHPRFINKYVRDHCGACRNSLMRSTSAHPRLKKKTMWRKLQV
nr:callose synthase 9-like [Tanacetum cinerariifolium]